MLSQVRDIRPKFPQDYRDPNQVAALAPNSAAVRQLDTALAGHNLACDEDWLRILSQSSSQA